MRTGTPAAQARRFPIGTAIVVLVLSFVRTGLPNAAHADDTKLTQVQQRGKAIYAKQCAGCHGNNGEGVANKYAEPLVGDDSLVGLTKTIVESMPESKPQLCVGDDAKAVAEYIYEAFYSPAAQVRNRPARVSLARLTANQLRQSLSDLYSHFVGIAGKSDKLGVEAEYYTEARANKKNLKIKRIDPAINFDWGDKGPGSGINPQAFYIQWRTGIRVDETGRYTIVLRSTCAFVCSLGTSGEFINNHVQSGDKTEFRKSVHLTAGRVYPFSMRFYQRKRKTKQPPARVSLSWIAPHGVEQVIPTRNLIAGWTPNAFALQAKLPPDDRSYGYERGISVDRQWDDSVTAAAVEFASVAVHELWPRYRRQKGNRKDRALLKSFLSEFASTAFRGPLDNETRQFYVDDQLAATDDDAEAIKRSVIVCLKSPRFLYPLLDANRSQSQQVANRLTLTLFDSLPADRWLIDRVKKGLLEKDQHIRLVADRMVDDHRTRAKMRAMLHAWLNLSHFDEIKKDEQLFPGFDEPLVADLRTSLDAFLDDVVWSDSSDYRNFFRSDWSYTNPRIGAFYGDGWLSPASKSPAAVADKAPTKAASAEGSNDSQPRQLAGKPQTPTSIQGYQPTAALTKTTSNQRRAGVLTHPYLLSGLAYRDSTSPVHRGVFLIRYMLGRTLRPPNEAFTPLSPKLHPDLTTRERVELQTSPASCQVCHSKINALGFALENYDAVGRYRVEEQDKPIDSTGRYATRSGKIVHFKGVSELANYLAESEDAQQAFVGRAFQHFVKQPAAAYGAGTLSKLTNSFRENNFNIRELLIEIAIVASKPTT